MINKCIWDAKKSKTKSSILYCKDIFTHSEWCNYYSIIYTWFIWFLSLWSPILKFLLGLLFFSPFNAVWMVINIHCSSTILLKITKSIKWSIIIKTWYSVSVRINFNLTHTYSFFLVINSSFVFFPVDGGFGVSPGGLALQDCRLSSRHYNICGILPEVIP